MVIKLNQEAIDKYGILPSKYRYNNLMVCYAKQNRPVEAENVLREMLEKGLEPDVVTFTTLIDAYKRDKQIDKCWEIFQECRTMKLKEDVDELLLSYMVRLAAATHESEKALKIFAELETEGYTE